MSVSTFLLNDSRFALFTERKKDITATIEKKLSIILALKK